MNKATIFKQAWKSAREGAVKFGGRACQYFAQALRDTYQYIKTCAVARTLDNIAARASTNGATRKQTFFLASLMVKAGEDGVDMLLNSGYRLTVREASSLIDTFKRAVA